MVIIRLMGCLGNQMFQYAAGRRLAHALGAELKLDISGFDGDKLRTYTLWAFNIQEHFATDEEVAPLTISKRGIIQVSCINSPSNGIKFIL